MQKNGWKYVWLPYFFGNLISQSTSCLLYTSFQICSIEQMDMKSPIVNLFFNEANCQQSIEENNGFYMAQVPNKNRAIIGIIGEIGGKLPLIHIAPSVNFLPFVKEEKKGAFFAGIDYDNQKIFPVVFE